MKSDTQPAQPWYKEPLMWLVAGIPAVTVCWGVVMITLAVSSKDSLVSDSYYKDGVSYTENVEMDHQASRLQIRSSLVFANHEARLVLDGQLEQEPDTLLLELIHPTLQERDLEIILQRTEPGLYIAAADIQLPSRRYVWLQSPDQGWRIRSTEQLEYSKVVQLNAQ
ncbi:MULTISPECIES: FixH family protein [unclassified Oceanobacter]|jgi:hypothetical protein|uniref:FixH family protein n=1 Tax=unclassified Oceanobacter TaxID=2620260 RepID=UPI0026E16B89|nr:MULTISPECIES: FixH family protein [unclassified Oceanobacter]MDO6683227.1 FixH family protein [Oceanobacter sp. 5_MG-2023]MDP2506174.1 FixH family protein [Oceanobacter sp. 3_MG-2023]MDP2547285.1 FixH family protein [Oceanobacter sp. 4_MG-2023]MDP2607409.1 FixH family protein [Oceanobacter sp. 1_MG-2023]MDP2610677.1 FixH family protein [Oceanobacter sp. 2_MG-2023]